jgi:hypothetical protein
MKDTVKPDEMHVDTLQLLVQFCAGTMRTRLCHIHPEGDRAGNCGQNLWLVYSF